MILAKALHIYFTNGDVNHLCLIWSLKTKGRIPLFLKYVISTSVFKLLLTVNVFPDDNSTLTY